MLLKFPSLTIATTGLAPPPELTFSEVFTEIMPSQRVATDASESSSLLARTLEYICRQDRQNAAARPNGLFCN